MTADHNMLSLALATKAIFLATTISAHGEDVIVTPQTAHRLMTAGFIIHCQYTDLETNTLIKSRFTPSTGDVFWDGKEVVKLRLARPGVWPQVRALLGVDVETISTRRTVVLTD